MMRSGEEQARATRSFSSALLGVSISARMCKAIVRSAGWKKNERRVAARVVAASRAPRLSFGYLSTVRAADRHPRSLASEIDRPSAARRNSRRLRRLPGRSPIAGSRRRAGTSRIAFPSRQALPTTFAGAADEQRESNEGNRGCSGDTTT